MLPFCYLQTPHVRVNSMEETKENIKRNILQIFKEKNERMVQNSNKLWKMTSRWRNKMSQPSFPHGNTNLIATHGQKSVFESSRSQVGDCNTKVE